MQKIERLRSQKTINKPISTAEKEQSKKVAVVSNKKRTWGQMTKDNSQTSIKLSPPKANKPMKQTVE